MADIRITGRMVNAIRITLDTNDHDAIRQQLSKTLQNASTAGALVVLESSVEQEIISLIQLLLDLDVQPMAVQEGILAEQARAIQFPVIPAQGHGISSQLQEVKATKEQVVEAPAPLFRGMMNKNAGRCAWTMATCTISRRRTCTTLPIRIFRILYDMEAQT